MKFALLAAVAVIATPVLAQETPATATMDQTAPAGDPSQPAMPDQSTSMPQSAMPAQPGPAGDPSMQQPPAAPMDPVAADAAGGYQPAGPATTGPVQPGAQVVFKPAPSPSEAFPPPPPMKSYPLCKKGQYDNCMQRGGK